jgi:hypothetical protein
MEDGILSFLKKSVEARSNEELDSIKANIIKEIPVIFQTKISEGPLETSIEKINPL